MIFEHTGFGTKFGECEWTITVTFLIEIDRIWIEQCSGSSRSGSMKGKSEPDGFHTRGAAGRIYTNSDPVQKPNLIFWIKNIKIF